VIFLATQLKQKTFHEEWREITDQIKRLENMRVENCKEIKRLHNRNAALKETIKQLKEKRTKIIFLLVHIPER